MTGSCVIARESDLDAGPGFGVALAGDRVEQLGSAAELGVVDRRARTLVGVEEFADQRRVAIEDLVARACAFAAEMSFEASSSACWRRPTRPVLTWVSSER